MARLWPLALARLVWAVRHAACRLFLRPGLSRSFISCEARPARFPAFRRGFDALSVCLLVGLAVWLFRGHVLGRATYIGNPDRLCSHLKILKFHADGIARGRLDAWSDGEMMGYDSFALPYTFPNPTTYLAAWLGLRRLYVTAGFFSLSLLALAGVATYAFLRALAPAGPAPLAGAILYQFSALTTLKVSQNDMSFAVFILIPLMALVVLRTSRERLGWRFAQLALLVFALLHFMFLQKAAYALMLVGCYALYRAARERDWRPPTLFAAAVLTGAVAAFPRIWGVATAMGQYTREIPGVNLHHFEDVYRYQHVLPYQILRWFDDGVFGRYPSESSTVLDNNVNLTEGFLLYTSSFVPFLVLLGLFRYRRRWLQLPFTGRADAGFFFWFLAFTVAVLTVKPVHHLLFDLFLRIDFTHARILIAGLLCLSALVTLLLASLAPASLRCLPPRRAAAVAIGSVVLAVVVLGTVEAFAHRWKGCWHPLSSWRAAFVLGLRPTMGPPPLGGPHSPRPKKPLVSQQAVARAAASGLAVLGLLAGIRFGCRRPLLAEACYGTLVLVLPVQALLAADFRVNGPQTAPAAVAFLDGNNYRANRSEFSPPRPEAAAALAGRLQRDQYRCVLLPDATAPRGFAGGHVPEFWQLRAVDGYYGLGVPARLAALPWPQGVGLRTISFPGPDLPWPLLGLLNVKFALVVDKALFANAARAGRAAHVIENPAPVTPRCFFARSVEPAASAREAAVRLFEGGRAADVQERSFVEGMSGPRAFNARGDVCLRGGGDRLEITFAPSDQERFLVVNDLYFPGWRAAVGGQEAPIYPTNAVMRGIRVPAGGTSVVLTYVPFVRSPWAPPFYAAGLVLLVAGALLFRRAGARNRAGTEPAEEAGEPHVACSA
jgi:hypothetical protein